MNGEVWKVWKELFSLPTICAENCQLSLHFEKPNEGDEEVIIRGSDGGWQATSCSADSRMCLTGKNENVLNVEKWVLSI